MTAVPRNKSRFEASLTLIRSRLHIVDQIVGFIPRPVRYWRTFVLVGDTNIKHR